MKILMVKICECILWLGWVFIMAHEHFIATHGLSPVAASGVYFLVVLCGLLIVMASLIVEHGL